MQEETTKRGGFKRDFIIVCILGIFIPSLLVLQQVISGGEFAEKIGYAEPRGFWYVYLRSILFSFLASFFILFGATKIIGVLQKRWPWKGQWAKRLLVETVTMLGWATTVMGLLSVTWKYFFELGCSYSALFFDNLILALTVTIIVTALVEGSYFFNEWKQALLREERLEKENSIARYEALRNQVNPHFLFNSLNTLSSLVHEDSRKAETFISKFADVYRYVLDAQENAVIELRKEMENVNSYIFLQQIRFESGLQVETEVDAASAKLYVVPMGVQLLVENAIKHNEVSKANPLRIQVYAQDGFLYVENNLQLRKEGVKSTGQGQRNLVERYASIGQHACTFSQTEKVYRARIPLVSIQAHV